MFPLRISLAARLSAALLAVVVLGTGTVAILARRSGGQEFQTYVATRAGVPIGPLGQARRIGEDGSASQLGPMAGHGPGALAQRTPEQAGTGPSGAGRMVGPTAMVASAEEEFLRRLDRTLWTAAGIAGAAALIVGIVTTRHLTHPLRDLHSAARRMAGGDLGVRVTPSGGPELSDLAHAFNQMAENLERQEQARRALVADVAHDLRTPVTVIQGTVDALLDGVFPPTNEHLRSIRQEAQRLGRLVHDLRDLSLVDTGQLRLEPRTINATDLAREALARASHQAAQHGVTLSLKASPDSTRPGEVPILVEADPHRMAQVLDNLLGNALRYIPDGGAITVHIERYAPQGASAYNKSQVAITVEDTGPGIAPEDQPHVFERFFRVDRARARDLSGAPAAGSGLGLTIVKGLVEASGGRVWVTSEPGQGARFTFTLPATPTPTPTPAPTPITTLGD